MPNYLKTTAASVALMSVLLAPLSPSALDPRIPGNGLAVAYAAESDMSQQLADGVYSIEYRFVKHDTEQDSVMQQYVVTPGRLIVANGRITAHITLKQSKEITGFQIDTGAGLVTPETVAEDIEANTRTVAFTVDDLSAKLKGWVKIYWQVSPTFLYDHEYDVDLRFDPQSLEAASEAPELPVEAPKPPETPQEPAEPVTPKPEPVHTEFSDLGQHWARAAIQTAVSKGIVNGYEDGTFRPGGQVTRAEFAAMLGRALQLENDSGDLSFTDRAAIPGWVRPYLSAIVDTGLVGGYEDGTFRPAQYITRAELAVIASRALQLETAAEAAPDFADADQIPAWARASVAAVDAAGLMNGRDGGRFAPQELATRAEAVSIILGVTQ